MAAAEPEVLLSQLIGEVDEIPNAIPTFLGSSVAMGWLSIRWDETGSQKSKMAAAKPEVLISHVLQQIDTQFQWLY